MHFEDLDNLFWTSDPHFNHKKILQYQPNRVYSSVEEMNEGLISAWNERVKPESTVILHGDFAFSSSKSKMRAIRERLNGRIILLMGNHDHMREAIDVFGRENIYQALVYTIGPERQSVHSCHHPMASWMEAEEGGWHTHGHYHNHEVDGTRYKRMDVGVDCHPKNAPFNYYELKAFMDSRTETPIRHR